VSVSSEILCRNLVYLRDKHGLTQEQAAAQIGMEYKYYQHVETGRRSRVRLDTLDKLAAAYGLTGSQLLVEPPPKSEIANMVGPVGRRRRKSVPSKTRKGQLKPKVAVSTPE
jgi:transcriptional regulator with XRE-family HTH domain